MFYLCACVCLQLFLRRGLSLAWGFLIQLALLFLTWVLGANSKPHSWWLVSTLTKSHFPSPWFPFLVEQLSKFCQGYGGGNHLSEDIPKPLDPHRPGTLRNPKLHAPAAPHCNMEVTCHHATQRRQPGGQCSQLSNGQGLTSSIETESEHTSTNFKL